jgi:hypothetical protein
MIKLSLLLLLSFNCFAEVMDECGVNWEDQPTLPLGGCFEIRADGVYRSYVAKVGGKDFTEIYIFYEDIEEFLEKYERID